jgi:hypothetical protein
MRCPYQKGGHYCDCKCNPVIIRKGIDGDRIGYASKICHFKEDVCPYLKSAKTLARSSAIASEQHIKG